MLHLRFGLALPCRRPRPCASGSEPCETGRPRPWTPPYHRSARPCPITRARRPWWRPARRTGRATCRSPMSRRCDRRSKSAWPSTTSRRLPCPWCGWCGGCRRPGAARTRSLGTLLTWRRPTPPGPGPVWSGDRVRAAHLARLGSPRRPRSSRRDRRLRWEGVERIKALISKKAAGGHACC